MTNIPRIQTREITAAVVRKKGGPFRVETLTLEEPRPDEALIRIVATGMCHTDMVARDQLYTVPLPVAMKGPVSWNGSAAASKKRTG